MAERRKRRESAGETCYQKELHSAGNGRPHNEKLHRETDEKAAGYIDGESAVREERTAVFLDQKRKVITRQRAGYPSETYREYDIHNFGIFTPVLPKNSFLPFYHKKALITIDNIHFLVSWRFIIFSAEIMKRI